MTHKYDFSPEAMNKIEDAIPFFREAQSILFITGAGVSAESGLPTYRGVGGLYEGNHTEDGIPIEEAISGNMLRSRPEISWKYLLEIARNASSKTYNRAHEVIALMEGMKQRVWTLTQNVDGFHTDAGSHNVIEIHGNFRSLSCMSCSHTEKRTEFDDMEIPPRCPACNGILRPDVVLFGEMLPTNELVTLEREMGRGFDLVVSVGTTSVFPYIAQPVISAKFMGKHTVEINPGITEVSRLVDVKIPEAAAITLDYIYEKIRPS